MYFQIIGVSTSLAIPSGLGDEYGEWPMYTRARNKFFDSRWYSNVTVNTLQTCGIQSNVNLLK